MKTNSHTYEKIAADYRLWQEFVDPHHQMTQAEFDALTTEQKVEIQIAAFGNRDSWPCAMVNLEG